MKASHSSIKLENIIKYSYFTSIWVPAKNCITQYSVYTHCKPKPCQAYRELPVSQFSQGKPCFHYREPCSHCRDPVSITGIFLKNPVLPCMGLHCCKTGPCQVFPSPTFSLEKPALTTGKILFFVN